MIGNSCALEREQMCGNKELTKVHDGPCACNVVCPMIFNPVCGSDGKFMKLTGQRSSVSIGTVDDFSLRFSLKLEDIRTSNELN